MRDRSRVESAPTDVRSAAELARARRSKTDGWGWRTRFVVRQSPSVGTRFVKSRPFVYVMSRFESRHSKREIVT
jgi:hypothetical protein